MTMYNATAELTEQADAIAGDRASTLLERFIDYHPVLTRSMLGRAELILSLPAQGLWQAVTTARHLLEDLPTARLTVETSEEFDQRSHAEVPALLSVTEAAARLGITRTGVQRRIENGTLPAVRVGNAWIIPAVAVPAVSDQGDQVAAG